jgi:tetratricopeptide (TPR) repeat protein
MNRLRHSATALVTALAAALLVTGLWAAGCSGGPVEAGDSPGAGLHFSQVAAAAGFHHRHHKPSLDPQLDNVMAWVSSLGAAAAAGDFDDDGRIDLFVTDSRKGEPDHLYHNRGDGTFVDVAAKAGLADVNGEDGVSMDAVWGDVDNDGWQDLFHNNHDGTFTDVTAERFRSLDGSPGTGWHNGNAAIFLDYDLDGRLDLYVGNYFADEDLWHLATTRIMHDDFEHSRNGGRNQLFHQEPDGTFVEVPLADGLDDPGWTLAVGSADLDNDGWPDLYCADDFGPDQVFLNRRDGTFADVSSEAIVPDTKKGMNVDFGDVNGDGWLDVYVTNVTTSAYLQEGNMLWHNNGVGPDGVPTFTDVSLETGTYDGGWGWGAKFFDADDDGDLDLVSADGFITAGPGSYWFDLATWTVTGKDPADTRNWPAIGDRSFSGRERTRFWRDDGLGTFSEAAREVGLDSTRDGRGVAVFDYDDDGDLDVFLANQGQPPDFYRNEGIAGNHWLRVALVGDPKTRTNRDGVGTRVTALTPAGHRMIRERDGGNGFAGQSDPRLHFGLGGETRVALLEVRWPDGGLQYFEDVAADQQLTVCQDPARYASRVKIHVGRPEAVPRRREAGQAPKPEVDPAALDAELSAVEARIRRAEGGYTLPGLYRRRCVETGRQDRAIAFFRDLVEARPEPRLRVELATAYIDKIPTCGGLAAVICKGTLARKALDQLDAVLEKDPDSWIGHYCRGINHLHWPRALRHSRRAAADLERCVELRRGAAARPEDLRVYVALGDAWAKAGDFGRARRAWRDGLALFPGAEELTKRLELGQDLEQGPDDELLAYVEDRESLERPIDTDLSFMDGPGAAR